MVAMTPDNGPAPDLAGIGMAAGQQAHESKRRDGGRCDDGGIPANGARADGLHL